MTSQNEEQKGIRRLDEDTLVQIIEGEVAEDGKLSDAGRIALHELSERTSDR